MVALPKTLSSRPLQPPTAGPAPRDLCAALRRAACTPRGLTLLGADDLEERRPWAAVWDGALRRAAALRARGLSPGDAVVLVLPTSFEFVESFFAVLLAGGVPAPAYPPVAMARLKGQVDLLAHTVRATSARYLITDAKIGRAIGEVARVPCLREIVDVRRLDAEPDGREVLPSPRDVGLIQCTSGSTSSPSPVLLRHDSLMANIAGLQDRFQMHAGDVAVSWLPLYHDLGLIGQLLCAVVSTHELVLLPPPVFLLDPAAWWRAVARHRATITAAPCFAFGLSERRMDERDLAGLDLSSLRVCASGAEPVQPATMRAFFDKFAAARFPRGAFCAAYGLAESCVGVTGAAPGDGLREDWIDREALEDPDRPRAVPAEGDAATCFVSVGRPLPGAGVTVRDARGRPLPERHVGEVWVAGSSVMAGYKDQPEKTAEVLQGGELRTGDLGYLAGGELVIVGREKHMLIVRGRNYHAEPIEAVAETVEGVRKGNAVAFGVYDERRGCDNLHLVVETRLEGADARRELERAIAAAVAEEIGLTPARVALLPPNAIPKTSSGKKRRHACRELVLSGRTPRRGTRRRAELAGVVTLLRSQLSRAEQAARRVTRRAS